MPPKIFDIEDVEIVIHFPTGADNISYNELLDKFRIEQMEKSIAMYPPKAQLAMLDWLEGNIVVFE